MNWSKSSSNPFPQWVRFPSPPSMTVAGQLGLASGDGISVRLGVREVPMDLLTVHGDSFVVCDPDGTTHVHKWSEAISYWKRIGPMKA
jgi:hypothetical protein